ncbi:metallopeptidase family protein [Plantibacter sp. Mn2098]|uniref:metallopeptidase family protein n=1 Tax=Plantibacter sp. Mn2098 TaxID=3395266 RepID=UPI003BE2A48C
MAAADEETREALARRRSRHGRAGRSIIVGPNLPPLTTRVDQFDLTVATTADYLRGSWPDELADVTFEVAPMPMQNTGVDGVDRWKVNRAARTIILYRLPIQRLSKLHQNDELHQRMMVESCVFRAVAELLGKDPWDLGPDRFRFL